MEIININIHYGLKHNSVEAKAFEDKIKIIEEKNTMSNKSLVPEAKEALNKFKMEAASDVGVNLKQGYNGDLTAKQAGSIGGQMVNIMTPARTKVCSRKSRTGREHMRFITYKYALTVS